MSRSLLICHESTPLRARAARPPIAWTSLAVLAMLRVLRRWTQTGQKFVGSPDIAYTFLPQHPRLLWTLVGAALLDLGRRLTVRGLPGTSRQVSAIFAITVMCLTGSFKLSFMRADAPELLAGFEQYLRHLPQASLLSQAQAVFLAIGLAAVYAFFQARWLTRRDDRIMAVSALHDIITLLLINQSKVNNIPLFLLFYAHAVYDTAHEAVRESRSPSRRSSCSTQRTSQWEAPMASRR